MKRRPSLNPINAKHAQIGAIIVKFKKQFFNAIRVAAVVAAGLSLAEAQADAGLYPQTRASLEAQIPSILARKNIVGLSIALIDDQNVVWSQGFGYADKAKGIRADGDTLYRAGSISKLFTATAAMQLAEQGKIDIDAPIQTYVPTFSIKSRFADATPITPRLLMTHHSGLPTDRFKGFFTDADFSGMVENLQDDYVAYPPQLILNYSNVGFALLGTAIENACGKPFASCLEDTVLRPIGMANAGFAHGESASPLMSRGYLQGEEAPEAVLRDVPAGGLNASVLELGKFAQMVFAKGVGNGQRILTEASLAEMFRPQNEGVALDFDTRIGLAWFLNRPNGGSLVAFHDGGLESFYSALIVMPDSKLGVVVLSNSAESSDVVGGLAASALQAMAAEQSGGTPPAQAKAPEHGNTEVPAEGFVLNEATIRSALAGRADYPGDYQSEHGIIHIRRQGKSWSLQINGQTVRMQPRADGRFKTTLAPYGDVVLERSTVDSHPLLVAEIVRGGRGLAGEKVAPHAVPRSWRKRLGRYVVQNPDPGLDGLQISLSSRHGHLIATIPVLGERILIPVSDTEAVMSGLGRAQGETFSLVDDGGSTELRYSGYRFKRQ